MIGERERLAELYRGAARESHPGEERRSVGPRRVGTCGVFDIAGAREGGRVAGCAVGPAYSLREESGAGSPSGWECG